MRLFAVATIMSLSALFTAAAGAQTMDTAGPHSSYCGQWMTGTWTSNGNCVEETTTTTTTTSANPNRPDNRVSQRVAGTITSVTGHMVTVQQSAHTLVINDTPALQQQMTGRVAVGRQVVAHGYWQDGTFYASRIQ